MGDKLQIATPTTTLTRGASARAGLIARGRREATSVAENADFEQGIASYRAGDFEASAASLRIAADAGHAEAAYLLSVMLDDDVVAGFAGEAAEWELRAANAGHAYAQANRSFRAYEDGDFGAAFAWCQRAAHAGLPWAMFHVGLMHRKGEGTAQSDTEAARWYEMAAERGFAEAARKLAELYALGAGVRMSAVEAARWYRRAGDANDAEAMFQLGQLYMTGLGVERDYAMYRAWTRRAADAGHEPARREMKKRAYRDPW